ncbi:DEAD/DEAH box helicase family protein, partial [Aedoeadaptatus coxii]|uniref:DEAD/DEAH box helicase family protein n=1 Tax=Aedoeadaptatus coxii TaxID=755172 RepID=UPI002AD42681
MKFNFRIQDYQTQAVKAVVDCFRGQPYVDGIKYRRDVGDRLREGEACQMTMGGAVTGDFSAGELDDTGFKNERLHVDSHELLNNVKQVQQTNNLMVSDGLIGDIGACSLDIEMETGTGKTYVYIKTMYELYKAYGWSKFIVVVPSIAIREGVKKSFEMTKDHFMEQYGKRIRFFVYDSKNLNQLDSFSSDAGINVMIINMQAFNTSLKEGAKNKDARIIYSERDEFSSRRPIDVIKANNPILILDEPQKMGGKATQAALKNFNPLFTLNYSATHARQHNLVYALDAVDAYNEKLVKKIEVKGFQIKNLRGTDRYLYLDDIILSPKEPPKARIEFEVARKNGIKRE